jgi:hypothetical protein
MIYDVYEWGMAMSIVNNRLGLEGAMYNALKTGKNRVRQKPKDYKKKKKAKRRMSKRK